MSETAYRTVDIRLAPAGWTIHFLNAEGKRWAAPLVGWVIRDQHDLDRDGDFVTYTGTAPYRHISAGYVADGQIETVDDDPYFWYVAAPGEPEPTADQIAKETKTRQAADERQRQIAARRTAAA